MAKFLTLAQMQTVFADAMRSIREVMVKEIYEPVKAIADQAKAIADGVRRDAEAGKFDGEKGERGDTGDAAKILSKSVTYQVGDSGNIIPSGSWSISIPVVPQGKYLWTKTEIQFNSGDPIVSYVSARQGMDGSGSGSVASVNDVRPNEEGNIALTADDVGALPAAGGDMTGGINMNGQSISGLNDPTEGSQAARKGYVDAAKAEANAYTDAAKAEANAYTDAAKAEAIANADAVTRRSLDALWKLNQGISYQFETDNTDAYSKTVPSGAKLASVETVGGKTLVWNQWVLPISSENVSMELNSKVSVSDGIVTMYPRGDGDYSSFVCMSNFKRMANMKYYLRYTAKSSAWSQNAEYAGLPIVQGLWVPSAAVDKSVADWQTKSAIFAGKSDGSAGSNTFSFRKYAESSNAIVYVKDIVVISLTQLFGSGNEPSSLDDSRITWIEQYVTANSEYNAGDLVSADVESVKYNDAVVAEIPEAVRTLPGYGWSANDVCNAIERTGDGWQYVQRVGSRDYQDGDTVTDGVTTYYVLDTPVITDINDLMDGILDAVTVEDGGTLTFENAVKLSVPNSVEYAVKLSEVNG